MSDPTLITAGLSILESVGELRMLQFPNLDFVFLHEYIGRGTRCYSDETEHLLDKELTRWYKEDGEEGDKPTKDDLGSNGQKICHPDYRHKEGKCKDKSYEECFKAAETEVMSRYEFRMAEILPDFVEFVKLAAPSLVRFSRVAKETRTYVKEQIKHTNYLIAIGSLIFAVMVVVIALFMGKEYVKHDGVMTLTVIRGWLKKFMLFVVFLTVMNIFLILLRSRRKKFQNVQLSLFDRYDRDLGRNVFVEFAEAETRGVRAEFIRSYTRQTIQEVEDEEDEDPDEMMLYTACSVVGATNNTNRNTQKYSKVCLLNSCERDTPMSDTFENHFREAWKFGSNKDTSGVSKCANALIAMLSALADIQLGKIKDADQNSLWHQLQDGMDDARTVMYRALDERLKAGDKDSLEVVKQDIIPLLKLDVIEVFDLKPFARTVANFNLLYKDSKTDAWKVCRERDDCLWAYYVPDRGCIFGIVGGCDNNEEAGGGCVVVDDLGTDNTMLEYVSGNDDNGVLLLKSNPPDAQVANYAGNVKSIYVTKKDGGISNEFWNYLQPLVVSIGESNVTGRVSCAERGDCHVIQKNKEQSDDPDENSEKPFTFSNQGKTPTYIDAFSGTFTRKDNTFQLKQSPHTVFELNLSDNANTTFHAFSSDITEKIVAVMKKHHGNIDISKYSTYIQSEMHKTHGPSQDLIRPMYEEIMRNVVKRMRHVYEMRGDSPLYVTATRFEEKMKSLGYAETRELVEKMGSLSKATKSLGAISKGREGPEDTSGKIIDTLAINLITFVFLLTLLYILGKVKEMYDESSDFSGLNMFTHATVAICVFLLFVVLVSSMVLRYRSNIKFNKAVGDRNSRDLTISATNIMESTSHLLEKSAHDNIMRAEADASRVEDEFVTLYKKIDNSRRLSEISRIKNGDNAYASASSPPEEIVRSQYPDLEALYMNMKNSLEKFDRCNTLTGPSPSPFPVYELTVYLLIICCILAVLWVALKNINVFRRLNIIGDLFKAMNKIKKNLPEPKGLERLLTCGRPSTDVKEIMTVVMTIIFTVFLLFIMNTIVMTSKTYEMGLYASSMFTMGQCTRGGRKK